MVDSRSLPTFAAGAVDVPYVIQGMDELVSRDTGTGPPSSARTPSPRELFVHLPKSDLLAPVAAALVADPGDQRTLTGWAATLGVSERTITRAFRAETELSFARWQAALRTQRAVLLLTRGAGVEETARCVGYRSASAFGAAFRRATGRTPAQFRPAA